MTRKKKPLPIVPFFKWYVGIWKKIWLSPNLIQQMLKGNNKTPLPPINTGAVYGQQLADGAQYRSILSESIVPAGGKNARVESKVDLTAVIQAFDATEDNMQLIFDSYILAFDFESTCKFLITPFLYLLENGEVITATSSDTADPMTAILATTAGTAEIKIGEVQEGRPFRDNGVKYYQAKVTLDITAEVNAFVRKYYQEMIDEETINPFGIGFHTLVVTDDTAVNIDRTTVIDYHFKEIKRQLI
jgi:hypothetical protein